MDKNVVRDNIFYYLGRNGMAQNIFAERIGVKPQVVSDWKNNRNSSYMKYLDIIASCLNVPVIFLWNRDGMQSNHMMSRNTFNERENLVHSESSANIKKSAPVNNRDVISDRISHLSNRKLNRLEGYLSALEEEEEEEE